MGKPVHVPPKMWKCPNCGSGNDHGSGLCIDDDDRDPDEVYSGELYPADLWLRCYGKDKDGCECRWEGTIADVAKRWNCKSDTVPCPVCGVGHLEKAKAEKVKKALMSEDGE